MVDTANLLFRVAAVQTRKTYDAPMEDVVGLCMHISIFSILKFFNKFKPDFVVFVFEGKNNWRKSYTAEVKAKLQYKANRVRDPAMDHYFELLASFEEVTQHHTSICVLSHDQMEGDDLIAGYCQLYAGPDHEIDIISGDRDFIQLLKLPGVKLINPDDMKPRNLPGDKEYEPDLDYWRFKKCIRGDMGDYVASASPRERETKIRKAYTSAYERVNLLNKVWVDEDKVPRRVGDLFEQNVVLLDLWAQPEPYRSTLLKAVEEQTSAIGAYNHFHFLRFLERHKLKQIRDEATKFTDLFVHNQRFVRGEAQREPSPQLKLELNQPKAAGLLEF